MARKITVLEFLNLTSVASDDIPVTVKNGSTVVCKANNLRWLMSHGMPYELEANIREIKICKDNILIYIQSKSYTGK